MKAIIASIKDTFCCLLILIGFVFVVASIGRSFLQGYMLNPDGTPAETNFDSFLWAAVTSFQTLTPENVNDIIYSSKAGRLGAAGWGQLIFILVLFFIGFYFILSLFLAVMLYNFDIQSDEKEIELEELRRRQKEDDNGHIDPNNFNQNNNQNDDNNNNFSSNNIHTTNNHSNQHSYGNVTLLSNNTNTTNPHTSSTTSLHSQQNQQQQQSSSQSQLTPNTSHANLLPNQSNLQQQQPPNTNNPPYYYQDQIGRNIQIQQFNQDDSSDDDEPNQQQYQYQPPPPAQFHAYQPPPPTQIHAYQPPQQQTSIIQQQQSFTSQQSYLPTSTSNLSSLQLGTTNFFMNSSNTNMNNSTSTPNSTLLTPTSTTHLLSTPGSSSTSLPPPISTPSSITTTTSQSSLFQTQLLPQLNEEEQYDSSNNNSTGPLPPPPTPPPLTINIDQNQHNNNSNSQFSPTNQFSPRFQMLSTELQLLDKYGNQSTNEKRINEMQYGRYNNNSITLHNNNAIDYSSNSSGDYNNNDPVLAALHSIDNTPIISKATQRKFVHVPWHHRPLKLTLFERLHKLCCKRWSSRYDSLQLLQREYQQHVKNEGKHLVDHLYIERHLRPMYSKIEHQRDITVQQRDLRAFDQAVYNAAQSKQQQLLLYEEQQNKLMLDEEIHDSQHDNDNDNTGLDFSDDDDDDDDDGDDEYSSGDSENENNNNNNTTNNKNQMHVPQAQFQLRANQRKPNTRMTGQDYRNLRRSSAAMNAVALKNFIPSLKLTNSNTNDINNNNTSTSIPSNRISNNNAHMNQHATDQSQVIVRPLPKGHIELARIASNSRNNNNNNNSGRNSHRKSNQLHSPSHRTSTSPRNRKSIKVNDINNINNNNGNDTNQPRQGRARGTGRNSIMPQQEQQEEFDPSDTTSIQQIIRQRASTIQQQVVIQQRMKYDNEDDDNNNPYSNDNVNNSPNNNYYNNVQNVQNVDPQYGGLDTLTPELDHLLDPLRLKETTEIISARVSLQRAIKDGRISSNINFDYYNSTRTTLHFLSTQQQDEYYQLLSQQQSPITPQHHNQLYSTQSNLSSTTLTSTPASSLLSPSQSQQQQSTPISNISSQYINNDIPNHILDARAKLQARLNESSENESSSPKQSPIVLPSNGSQPPPLTLSANPNAITRIQAPIKSPQSQQPPPPPQQPIQSSTSNVNIIPQYVSGSERAYYREELIYNWIRSGAADSSWPPVGIEFENDDERKYMATKPRCTQCDRIIRFLSQKIFFCNFCGLCPKSRQYNTLYSQWYIKARYRDNVCCCIGPKNPIRRIVTKFLHSPIIEVFILLVVLYSCIILALDIPAPVLQPAQQPLPVSGYQNWLDISNYVVVGFFIFEIVLKMFAHGILFGENSYLSNGWNILDFVATVTSAISILATIRENNIQSLSNGYLLLRALRSIRVLRFLTLMTTSHEVISAIWQAISNSFIVVIFGVFLFLIYGILGVAFFKSRLYRCFDPNNFLSVDWTHLNYEQCLARDGIWSNPLSSGNFDHLGSAFLVLFQFSNMEAWPTYLYDLSSAKSFFDAPQHDYNPFATLYVIVGIILVGFFFTSLLSSIIIGAYEDSLQVNLHPVQAVFLDMYKMILDQRPIHLLLPPQPPHQFSPHTLYKKQSMYLALCLWVMESDNTQQQLLLQQQEYQQQQELLSNQNNIDNNNQGDNNNNQQPERVNYNTDIPPPLTTNEQSSILQSIAQLSRDLKRANNTTSCSYCWYRLRLSFYKLITWQYFDIIPLTIVLLNVIFNAIIYPTISNDYKIFCKWFTVGTSIILILECIAKLLALGITQFFSYMQYQFEFIIMLFAIIDLSTVNPIETFDWRTIYISPKLFATIRVLRLFEFIRFVPSVKKFSLPILFSLKALTGLGVILALVIFIYAIIGMNLFSNAPTTIYEFYDTQFNFTNFISSILFLFKSITGESWPGVMGELQLSEPFCDNTIYRCGAPAYSIIYFVTFQAITTFLILNMIIAVIFSHIEVNFQDTAISRLNKLNNSKIEEHTMGRIEYSWYWILKKWNRFRDIVCICPGVAPERQLVRQRKFERLQRKQARLALQKQREREMQQKQRREFAILTEQALLADIDVGEYKKQQIEQHYIQPLINGQQTTLQRQINNDDNKQHIDDDGHVIVDYDDIKDHQPQLHELSSVSSRTSSGDDDSDHNDDDDNHDFDSVVYNNNTNHININYGDDEDELDMRRMGSSHITRQSVKFTGGAILPMSPQQQIRNTTTGLSNNNNMPQKLDLAHLRRKSTMFVQEHDFFDPGIDNNGGRDSIMIQRDSIGYNTKLGNQQLLSSPQQNIASLKNNNINNNHMPALLRQQMMQSTQQKQRRLSTLNTNDPQQQSNRPINLLQQNDNTITSQQYSTRSSGIQIDSNNNNNTRSSMTNGQNVYTTPNSLDNLLKSNPQLQKEIAKAGINQNQLRQYTTAGDQGKQPQQQPQQQQPPSSPTKTNDKQSNQQQHPLPPPQPPPSPPLQSSAPPPPPPNQTTTLQSPILNQQQLHQRRSLLYQSNAHKRPSLYGQQPPPPPPPPPLTNDTSNQSNQNQSSQQSNQSISQHQTPKRPSLIPRHNEFASPHQQKRPSLVGNNNNNNNNDIPQQKERRPSLFDPKPDSNTPATPFIAPPPPPLPTSTTNNNGVNSNTHSTPLPSKRSTIQSSTPMALNQPTRATQSQQQLQSSLLKMMKFQQEELGINQYDLQYVLQSKLDTDEFVGGENDDIIPPPPPLFEDDDENNIIIINNNNKNDIEKQLNIRSSIGMNPRSTVTSTVMSPQQQQQRGRGQSIGIAGEPIQPSQQQQQQNQQQQFQQFQQQQQFQQFQQQQQIDMMNDDALLSSIMTIPTLQKSTSSLPFTLDDLNHLSLLWSRLTRSHMSFYEPQSQSHNPNNNLYLQDKDSAYIQHFITPTTSYQSTLPIGQLQSNPYKLHVTQLPTLLSRLRPPLRPKLSSIDIEKLLLQQKRQAQLFLLPFQIFYQEQLQSVSDNILRLEREIFLCQQTISKMNQTTKNSNHNNNNYTIYNNKLNTLNNTLYEFHQQFLYLEHEFMQFLQLAANTLSNIDQSDINNNAAIMLLIDELNIPCDGLYVHFCDVLYSLTLRILTNTDITTNTNNDNNNTKTTDYCKMAREYIIELAQQQMLLTIVRNALRKQDLISFVHHQYQAATGRANEEYHKSMDRQSGRQSTFTSNSFGLNVNTNNSNNNSNNNDKNNNNNSGEEIDVMMNLNPLQQPTITNNNNNNNNKKKSNETNSILFNQHQIAKLVLNVEHEQELLHKQQQLSLQNNNNNSNSNNINSSLEYTSIATIDHNPTTSTAPQITLHDAISLSDIDCVSFIIDQIPYDDGRLSAIRSAASQQYAKHYILQYGDGTTPMTHYDNPLAQPIPAQKQRLVTALTSNYQFDAGDVLRIIKIQRQWRLRKEARRWKQIMLYMDKNNVRDALFVE